MKKDSAAHAAANVAAITGSDSAKHVEIDALQRQFLPAALEIQDAPPSPLGRILLWLLVTLFALGVLWSAFGRVDIVVSAPGKIIPSGQVKIVQAPEAGTVANIHVAEGDRVILGQPLISLDTTYANADDTRIAQQLAHNRLQHYWRQALESWFASGMRQLPDNLSHHTPAKFDLEMAKTLLQQKTGEILASTEAFDRELAASAADKSALQAEQHRATTTLQVLRERVVAYETLLQRQYGARVQYLEMLQQQTELEQTLPVLIARQNQLAEAAAALVARKKAAQTEIRSSNLIELARLQAAYDDLAQDARKAGLREKQHIITAPATGQVQELTQHTIGGIVTAAQPLMKIVPENTPVEIEAMLMNRDIGFVREGQRAEVKVEAFNFTKYGLLEAQVLDISDDAIQDEQLGWVFKMRLALKQQTLLVEGKEVTLSPGMAVASEITTGKRRLIEFFLSPLLRYRQESLRER